MRELDLLDYKKSNGEPYGVRKTLAIILFHPNQKIEAREAILRDKLCEKIEKSTGNMFLLEERDWEKLKQSVETLPYVGRDDIKLIERILNAQEVPVVKE